MADDQTATPAAPPAAPPDEGFFHSLATSQGVDPDSLGATARAVRAHPAEAAKEIGSETAAEIAAAAEHPINTMMDAAKGVISAATNPDAQATAREHLRKTGLSEKAIGGLEYLTSGIPLLGGGLVKSEEQAAQGNVRGSLGTLTGTVAPLLTGEAAKVPEQIHEAGAAARESMTARSAARLDEARTGKVITVEPQKQLPAAPAALPAAPAEAEPILNFESVGGKQVKPPTSTPTITHEPVGRSGGIVRLMDNDKEVGRVRYTIPQEDRPAAGAVTAAHIEPQYRGQGHAQALYLRAADELRAKGVPEMTSDLQGSTTLDAARVWDGLQQKGHPVEKISSKAGSPGYKMDLTQPRVESAPKTVDFSSVYGDTGKQVKGASNAESTAATTATSGQPEGSVRAGDGEPVSTGKQDQLAAHEQNGGSTFTPEGDNLAGKDLYSVGSYPERTLSVDKLTPEVLAKFKTDNADLLAQDDHAVGTWKDPDTGKSVLDIAKLYADRDEAVEAGQVANQKSIFHLGSMSEIPTGGTGEGTLTMSERQTALKQPWNIYVKNPDGTQRVETVDAFSSKDALKTAQKKFPEGSEWEIAGGGERTPSTEYKVPKQKVLSIPEAIAGRLPEQTMRHELGHAMVGMNEGLTPIGMLRHTHPDMSGAVAAMSWDASKEYQPGTHLIKPDRLNGVVRAAMGGIAADEVFNDLPRAANHNFYISRSRSDGGSAYRFLKAAGYDHDTAMQRMHDAIDYGKEHLTKPAVSDIIKENESVREPNLSRQFHYSAERLNNMAAEAKRRMTDEATKAGGDDRTAIAGRDADSGTDVARGEGEGAGGPGQIVQKEITPALAPGETLEDRAIKAYGVTDDPAKMGFILPDGRGLDFSQGKPARTLDHGDVSSILPRTGADAVAYNENPREVFTERTGAARIMLHKGGVNVVLPASGLTPEQGDVILRATEKHPGDVTIDIRRNGKIGSASGSVTDADSLDRLVRDAKRDAVRPGAGTVSARSLITAETKAPEGINTVSTRVPSRTVKGETVEDHTDQSRISDMEAAKAAPGYVAKMVNRIKDTPGFKVPEGDDAQTHADAYIRHVADNVKFVYNKLTPEAIAKDEQWYPVGAHDRGIAVAKQHGFTPEQIYGVTSVESPMTDWDQNTSLAERTANIWKNQQNTKFTPEMQDAADRISSIPAMKKFKPMFKDLRGKTLSELPSEEKQAWWLRLYDEGHNSRDYETWNPDGTSGGLAKNMDGTPRKVGWSFQRHIEKAINILQDGSPENISRQLGYGHKVRNFYNNQAAPNDPRFLTIDTHAVNVTQLRPMSGKAPAVKDNFGNIKNGEYGLKGIYPLHDAGYRLAAKELDIPIPSRLQSSTWVKIREVFNDNFKTDENLKAVDAIWKEHSDGKITADEARNRVWDYAERWNREAAGGVRNPSDTGELFAPGVRGESPAGATGPGDRGATPGTTSETAVGDEGDTSFNFGANAPEEKPEPKVSFAYVRPGKSKSAAHSATDLLKAFGKIKK